ncbi:MAG: RNA polymerase sigma factor [Bacteroidota bacterium]|nr:RNA polymerase sigma factor [Bacteroidota bacterium]MDQ6888714.1 RNA polymerase sigma factor [Bacteroidota bacterium]
MTTTGNHTFSEIDLIQGCIDGNRQMQEQLYQKYSSKMYGVCLRYSGNVEDANDLLQEGFIKIFKNLIKFRGEGSFEGWMRRIFVNTSIEHFRKKVKLYNVGEVQENTIEDNDWNILDTLAEKDIIALVNELSPGYKAVFNMHVIEGYSHKEIADILGITEGTSKSQLARAKGVLKKSLESRLNKTSNGKIN